MMTEVRGNGVYVVVERIQHFETACKSFVVARSRIFLLKQRLRHLHAAKPVIACLYQHQPGDYVVHEESTASAASLQYQDH